MPFHGKTALVLGASSGIGRAAALRLAAAGARVAVLARRIAVLDELITAPEFHGEGIAVAADVTDEEALRDAVGKVVGAFGGRLDVLVCSAGGSSSLEDPEAMAEIGAMSKEAFMNMYALNCVSKVVAVAAAEAALLAAGGAVVHVSSVSSVIPNDTWMGYSSAMAALDHVVKSQAIGYAGRGVRVNSVNPAVIVTPLAETMVKGLGTSVAGAFALVHPVKRVGTVEETAEAIAFLADNSKSAFITGTCLMVDGGCAVSTWWTADKMK